MKEFIDKLISRLEESKERYEDVAFFEMNTNGHTLDFEHSHGKEDGVSEAIEIVNELAEEYKQKEYCWQTCGATEHCKECRRLGNGDIDYYESIGEYINTSTEHINCSTKVSEMPTGWIPCSERLPEVNGWYLVTNTLGVVQQQHWGASHWQKLRDEAVIAWMPLPAPYTEGE